MNGKKHKFEKLSGKILGAAIEVHKVLRGGFIESIYHNALKRELTLRNIPFETEKIIRVYYKDELVGEHRLDLIVGNEIVIELKATKEISDAHRSQIYSYLKASGLHVGLILNFKKSRVEIRRFVHEYES